MKALSEDKNIVWHHATVNRDRRADMAGHRSVLVWFTGLSGSGKSTVAHATEEALYQRGCRTMVLDGDNVRHGLNSDLGFSDEDRHENIRRLGEVAKLFIDSGVIVMTAFISPFNADRSQVRSLVGDSDILEVFCRCPLEVCEQRDVKGLYKKARGGQIKMFTGISSPYEDPESADLVLDTDTSSIEDSVEQVLTMLEQRGVLIKV